MQIKTTGMLTSSELSPLDYSPQKTLVTVAVKMVIVQLAPLIASLVIARLIASTGDLVFSAYSLVNSINLTVFIVVSGMLQAIYVLGGNAIGKKEKQQYASIVYAGIWLSVILAIFATAFSAMIGLILKGLNYDANFVEYSLYFSLTACLSIFPSILLVTFRIHAALNQHAGIASILYLIGALFTVVISLLFHSQFDNAISITLFIMITFGASQWLMLLLALFFLNIYPELKYLKSEHQTTRPFELLKVLYAIGWPIGVVVFLDAFAPLFSSLFVGRLAIDAMPVHSAVSLWVVVFAIIPLGLSQSVVQQISILNGQQQFDARNQVALLAMLLTCAYGILVYLIFLTWSVEIGELLLGKANESGQQLLGKLMPLGGLLVALQGVIIVAAAILRGIGQTKAPMLQAVIGYLVIASGMQVLLGYFLEQGVTGIWLGMITGYFVTAIIISSQCWRWMKLTCSTTIQSK